MAWITLSAGEVDDLRGLLDRAAQVLEAQVVSGLRRRFGDAAGADQAHDGLTRWAAGLGKRRIRCADRLVRLDAGEVDGLTRLLDGAGVWLAAVARVRGVQTASALPERLAEVSAGLTALLEQAHAGPDPAVTTLGRAADPATPGRQGGHYP